MVDSIASPLWNSARFTLAFFAFVGFLMFYALRVNTGFAIVCMVNQTALRHIEGTNVTSNISANLFDTSDGCGNSHLSYSVHSNVTAAVTKKDGELVWNKNTQGLIHGSIFWGYILTNFAGGVLSTKFGGKHVIGFSLLVASVLTFFVPVVARYDPKLFMVLRFFTGMSLGFVSPSMQSLWSYWAPPLESSMLRSICFAGAQLGKVLTFPVTALLCQHGFDGGWPTVFYLQGLVGVIWFISWTLFVYNTPAQHPRISRREREYIEQSLHGMMPKHLKTKDNTPWRALLTSRRVWAIVIAHTCSNWGEYTFLTNIPTYMEEVLKFDIEKNGFLSSVPYVSMWAVITTSSWIADYVRKKGLLSTVYTRKAFTSIGFFIPAAFLVGLSFVGCSESLAAVVLLTLGVALTGTEYGAGFYMNAGDIAPKYAGVIYGISNTMATIPGFLAPLTIGFLTENQTQEEWRNVFYLAAVIYVCGALVFIFLGSGELQPWAIESTEVSHNEDVNLESKKENGTHLSNLSPDQNSLLGDCNVVSLNAEIEKCV